ncbi:hypothetical protein [Nocardiopsis quinghaiensis]|uniref:hypothetical protein n=1 Tax=Nocardiopsis quinghaiensis TaxID=464995 RepID=UPI001239BE86|nr:hypothetical protein [Nocardiopsis quinghaiensis]
MSPQDRHNPKVERHQEETSQGLAWVYQVRCTCGEEFDEYYAKQLAEQDKHRHLGKVAAPPAERCREPKKHRMRPHERCALCAGQLSLF